MRRLSLGVLALAIVALTAAGLGTAARFGVFQSGAPPAGESSLDPQAQGGGGRGGPPLPAGACPPAPESAGAAGNHFTFSGPCAFDQRGAIYCRGAGDDFYALLRRVLPGNRLLSLYVDVEYYHGPGSYDGTQTLLLIQDRSTLYTWSNFRTRATVTAGERELRLEPTRLLTEAGRGGSGVETVAGTLACGAPAPD